MLGFKDKFNVELGISERKFSEQLISLIDTEFDKLSDLKSDPKKLYTGNIKYNKFNLSSEKTIFGKESGKFQGLIKPKTITLKLKEE